MDNRPIGIFDSGLGGLSAVKEIINIMPNENIIYFGDTGRVPYGTKSFDTIKKYASQDVNFLCSHNVKMIISACGTVSSVAYDIFKDLSVPFTGVVIPASRAAVKYSKNKKIGVIGTSATIKSNSYVAAIKSLDNDIEIFGLSCPMFVSLVENGWIKKDDSVALSIAHRYLAPLVLKGIDTLILGCTHFPLLEDVITKVIGTDIKLINTGKEAARYSKKILSENNLLNDLNKTSTRKYFVSDCEQNFSSVANLFLSNSDTSIFAQKIDIENY